MHVLRLHGSPARQGGFSLGEVVATLGVLGVSLSLVVPSLSSVTQSNLRASGINELVGTLHVARSEALTLNQAIVICPSQDGESCAQVPWEAGWLRFVDGNGDFRLSPGERLLGVSPALGGLFLRTQAFGTAIGYSPAGRVLSPDSGQSGGDWTICPTGDATSARILTVSALGHPLLAERSLDGQEPDCTTG
jgi:type IV fimbrial biogenesis protein FimT